MVMCSTWAERETVNKKHQSVEAAHSFWFEATTKDIVLGYVMHQQCIVGQLGLGITHTFMFSLLCLFVSKANFISRSFKYCLLESN